MSFLASNLIKHKKMDFYFSVTRIQSEIMKNVKKIFKNVVKSITFVDAS
jgi:hypothetical protein